MGTPSPLAVLKVVESINRLDKATDDPLVVPTPLEVYLPPKRSSKPKPRDRGKVSVTNRAFRDSEALRQLQRDLNRSSNKK